MGPLITSLGNLFQCLTTVKHFFLISNISPPSLSLKPFPLFLSLKALVKIHLSHSPCLPPQLSSQHFWVSRPGSAAQVSSASSASRAQGKLGTPALGTACAWMASMARAPASVRRALLARPARAAARASTAPTVTKVPSTPKPHGSFASLVRHPNLLLLLLTVSSLDSRRFYYSQGNRF